MFSNNSHSFLLKQVRRPKRSQCITVFILGCIIFIFLLSYLAYGVENINEDTLIQINVLFRHGERTPTHTYPSDPHKDYGWPGGLGSLTNAGKLGMFQFGHTFRKQYGNFLGDLFFDKEISIQSSASPRCQMSAMTFFAGLFPPAGKQIWNKDLMWQPILVNPIPRNNDSLIANKAPCKAFDVEKVKSDDDLHGKLSDKDKSIFEFLSSHTDSFINNIEQVEFLYNTLYIEEYNGLTLPDWTKDVYPEPMKSMAAKNLASYTRTPKLKRLYSGPLLKQWLENMESGKKKAYFYSAHDITIVNFMRTIGFSREDYLPDYGATFILEVHQIKNEKIVKAKLYKSHKEQKPEILPLPNCETEHCLFESLKESVKPFIPEDWVNECGLVV